MMPEISNIKGKFRCENVTLPGYVAINKNFEILKKLRDK